MADNCWILAYTSDTVFQCVWLFVFIIVMCVIAVQVNFAAAVRLILCLILLSVELEYFVTFWEISCRIIIHVCCKNIFFSSST